MRQGADEIDGGCLKRLRSSADALKLAGGDHLLVSPTFINKVGSRASDKEFKIESEEFLAILLLSNADPGRYKALNTELMRGEHCVSCAIYHRINALVIRNLEF